MHHLKAIREHLEVTQQAMAAALGCAQGNIGHYEKGQTLPPDRAMKLIEFAASLGLTIGFDHIYGGARLPVIKKRRVRRCEQTEQGAA